jgi:GT2 family glycosyltransferase
MSRKLTRFPYQRVSHERHRAAALQRALLESSAEFVGWLDPALALSDDQLSTVYEQFADADIAAVTLAGYGRCLTRLGIPSCERNANDGPPSAAVLYAPEGVAIYHRTRVLNLGGFDTTLTVGHEDANLGWRLALRGLRTSEVAVEAHRPLSIADLQPRNRTAEASLLRHRTANELATLIVCASDEWLHSALPCAIARTIGLAAVDSGVSADQFDFSRSLADGLSLPVESLARLLALDDLIRRLPALRERRRREQKARTRSDESLQALFCSNPVDEGWLRAAGDGARALYGLLTVQNAAARSMVAVNSVGGAPVDQRVPRVSFIVVTASGPAHLPACLASLAALDYPRDAVEVIVVDNGSREDPTDAVQKHYPGAHLIRHERNLGFCGGNNSGAGASSHEWLFFLNDDTRVDPALLRSAFETVSRRRAAAVAAFVVDWTGQRVDYGGAGVNFEARGFQHGIGSPEPRRWQREHPVPFANGAAMLVRRDVYQEAGGFPDPYFAYYEDVALGWAVWLLGHEIWLSPNAVVYHRHHGTAGDSHAAARQRHCDRNACFTLITHASEAAISPLLSAALLLAAERVVLGVGFGGAAGGDLAFSDGYEPWWSPLLDLRLYAGHLKAELRRRGARREHGWIGSLRSVGFRGLVGACRTLLHLVRRGEIRAPALSGVDAINAKPSVIAGLVGVAEACRRAGEMVDRRRALQSARRMTDQQFASRFADNWMDPIPIAPERQAEYERAHRSVTREFELDRFGRGWLARTLSGLSHRVS